MFQISCAPENARMKRLYRNRIRVWYAGGDQRGKLSPATLISHLNTLAERTGLGGLTWSKAGWSG